MQNWKPTRLNGLRMIPLPGLQI